MTTKTSGSQAKERKAFKTWFDTAAVQALAAQVAAVADELDLAETPDFATLHRRLFDAAAPHSLQADLPDRARSEGLLLPEILEAAYLCREDEGKALDAAFAMMDALYARMRAGTGESGA